MNIFQKEEKYYMHLFKRYPINAAKAKNQYLWDKSGKKYLDFFSGISVCNLGHCNETVNKAIKKQVDLFTHVSNYYYADSQIMLAQELVKRTFPGKAFFGNSGAEANECAIKLARKWGYLNPKNGKKRYEIITFKESFHGRTMATMAATGQPKFHEYLKPIQEKFVYAQINDINSVKKLINDKTVAIMIEPIQGEGGIVAANKQFLKDLRSLCNQKNLLLIFDEIQCGMGRTGKFYAFENYGVKPDIVTLAKALANGLPLGACVASKKCSDAFVVGDHGSTFGGNPVSCAAGLAVLNVINKNFLANVNSVSKYFYSKLEMLKNKYSIVKELRGTGLMVGVELTVAGKDIVDFCMKKGVLINCTQNTVLRFLPPLTITKKDVDIFIKILEEALKHCVF